MTIAIGDIVLCIGEGTEYFVVTYIVAGCASLTSLDTLEFHGSEELTKLTKQDLNLCIELRAKKRELEEKISCVERLKKCIKTD